MIYFSEQTYIFCIVLLFSFSIIASFKLYQFSMFILSLESSIEECLDLLNEKYGEMYSILQKPIFFDSVEIRQMVASLKDSHDAVLVVANKLTLGKGLKGEVEKEDSSS